MRTLSLEHCGLSFARNAGIVAAHNDIIAFIDADAEADPDWLYHLVETLTRREAAAVGGRNFPPAPRSDLAAAIALAPGQPREVRFGDDELEQVCGCSMAIDKSRDRRSRRTSIQLLQPRATTWISRGGCASTAPNSHMRLPLSLPIIRAQQ